MAKANPTVPAVDVDGLTRDVPRGSWVAISSDHHRRVAVGNSVDDVISKSEAAGEHEPLIVRVPESPSLLVF